MTRLKRSVVSRRARSAAAMLGFGLLGTVLLGDAAMAKRVLAAEIDAAAPLAGSLPASPPPAQVPEAQVPAAQIPGAQIPGTQIPGAQVPVSEADFSSPAFSGDQAGDAAATLPDGSTGSEALGDSRSSGGTSGATPHDGTAGDGTVDGSGGNALSDRLFGLRPASPQRQSLPQPIAGSGGAQQVLSSGALPVMSYPVMSDTDIAAQLIPGRPDQLELLANLRVPLGMNTAAAAATPRFAAAASIGINGADANGADAAAAADRPHDAAIIARVPLPAALPMFGGALLALALLNRRGRRRARADRMARYRSAAT